MHYTIDHDPIEGGHLVVTSGELDVAATPRLSTVLAMTGTGSGQRVVLDLVAVDFIDSTALGTILRAAGELEAAGHSLAVVAPDGPVRRLLEMTNLTGRFRVYPTRVEALEGRPSQHAL
jgi:anti-anti-sigma factor